MWFIGPPSKGRERAENSKDRQTCCNHELVEHGVPPFEMKHGAVDWKRVISGTFRLTKSPEGFSSPGMVIGENSKAASPTNDKLATEASTWVPAFSSSATGWNKSAVSRCFLGSDSPGPCHSG